MDGSGAVIETRGLVKRFGDVNAVDGIDLDVRAGGVYGFLGPNGAGKTTTIRIFAGLLWPTRGSTRIFGEPVAPEAAVLARVGSLIERPALYPYLSAFENVRVFGTAHGLGPDVLVQRAAESLDRVGLAAVARRHAGGFSTGMRQRLALAIALIGRPDLVILDEPTNGLDPNGVVDVRELIARLAADGTTVFLSSHVLPEVEQLCDRVAILREGRIVAEGPTGDLLGTGERLYVRFDTPAEAAAALAILGANATPADAGPTHPGSALIVDAPIAEASRINRTLGAAGLYPAELAPRRESLEAVFRELTSDHPDGPPPTTPAPPPVAAAPTAGPAR
ncbi:MAG TPA: ABC transporter ATP-binding protein [Candidatus Limnocylindrales bacterium]|nr:ABC transporter ATP-binding protein [Candidatus Limnocylindrales bacterium]